MYADLAFPFRGKAAAVGALVPIPQARHPRGLSTRWCSPWIRTTHSLGVT